MNLAITGSNGFLGKYLVNEIRIKNPEIEIQSIDIDSGVNILNTNDLKKITKFDCIVHLAAKSFIPDSFKNPVDFYYANTMGTLNMLELCRKYNAKMVFLSSYVYGMPDYIPIDENHPIKAYNPYGQSKLICESLCQGYNRDFNIPITIFRPFNIYGIGQNPSFLISSIFSQINSGKRIIKLKDPYPKRDFIYIDDVVSAIISSLNSGSIYNNIYNICSGQSYAIREVTEIIKSEFSENLEFQFDKNDIRKNEVNDTKGDNNRIKKELNWKPQFNLYEGIRDMFNKEKI